MNTITLKQGREKSLLNYHPWIFSGSIAHADGSPGEIVDIRDHQGNFIARGYYNPHSQIRVRALTWDESESINADWWRTRLNQTIEARAVLANSQDLDTYRLVNAESDGLPGLIVDRYGDYLVIQALTLGIDTIKETLAELLVDLLKPTGIIERSDTDARSKEGLNDSVGLLWGSTPPTPLTITEHGVRLLVDLFTGHKTGFYLDQRDSRHWMLTAHEVAGREVLNAFSFTGGFGVCAALNGASQITNIDTSQPALDMAAQAMTLNGLEAADAEHINADVFQQLRTYRDSRRSFDLIILDPPKFAHNARQIEQASRGYKDINLLALKLLRPGGLLMTFSCSGHIGPDLFQKIVFGASIDAGRQAQIIRWLAQPADHPVGLTFPEGRYLKGLICRVMD